MMGGGDIVGILNSDDTYAESDIIEDVVETMIKAKVDSCYGNLANVDREETGKIIRHFMSGAGFINNTGFLVQIFLSPLIMNLC